MLRGEVGIVEINPEKASTTEEFSDVELILFLLE